MTPDRKYLSKNGPGFAGSAVLHLIALLIAFFWFKQMARPADEKLHTVLVDIVRLADETSAPPSMHSSPAPAAQATARQAPVAHSPQETVSPRATRQPDDLANRLNALSKLKAPETDPRRLTGTGGAPTATGSDDAAQGGDAAYSLRDFIRAQVLRRWNLDLADLGAQKIVIALHVVMKADGRILIAEIVDKHRYVTDAQFRRIALSAKNAVLLASPIALPPGSYPPESDMTLRLDPRDALR